MITMSKIIKNQIPREPREPREFKPVNNSLKKPVETMNLVAVESGRLQPLGCN